MEIATSSTKNKPSISNDAIFEILSWVPARSLMRFQWVCKSWFHLIRDPKFVKMHFLHHSTAIQEDDVDNQIINNTSFVMSTPGSSDLYSMSCRDIFNQSPSSLENIKMDCYKLPSSSYNCLCNNKEIEFWGSCNGLIYFSYRYTCSRTMYFISNPFTRELKDLPEINIERGVLNQFIAHGFGYDHTTDDYKVIRVVYYLSVVAQLITDGLNFHDGHHLYNTRMTNVYSLGSNSWSTKVETIPLITDDIHNIHRSEGLFINGTLHWIMKSPKTQAYMIRMISFDIVKEEHGEILLPDNFAKILSWSKSDSDLRVVNGCLCVFHINELHDYEYLHVWMMKDYGVKDSWTKLFTVNMEQLLKFQLSSFELYDLKVLKYGKVGGILMAFDGDYIVFRDLNNNKRNKFIRYRVRKIEDDDQFENLFVGATYIETLVSVNSGKYLTVAGSKIITFQRQKRKVVQEDPKPKKKQRTSVTSYS